MSEEIVWRLKELEDFVTKKRGRAASEMFEQYLRSISKKLDIAAYHSNESNDLLKEFTTGSDVFKNYTQMFKLSFGLITANISEEEKQRSVDFHFCAFKAEAHVIAYAHAMHSIIDMMAQVINQALGLGYDVHDVTIYKIRNGVAEFNSLHKEINELLKYEEYDYLKSFVNCQKHIILIPATYNFDCNISEGNRSHGLKIPSFSYKNKRDGTIKTYQSKWAHDFVREDFVKLRDKILKIGISLNNILSS